jgi:hypothetical protein
MIYRLAAFALVILTFGAAQAAKPAVNYCAAHLPDTKPDYCYSLVAAHGELPAVELDKDVVVIFQGKVPSNFDTATLRIDGSPLGVPPRVIDAHALAFPLYRTADKANRDLWARLLGRPFENNTRTFAISVTLGGKDVPFVYGWDPYQSPQPKIALTVYNGCLMALGLFLAALVFVVTVAMAMNTTIVRDVSIPQLRLKDRPYSLGRVQMATWFCVIFASVVFVCAVTYDINAVNAQSFVLMGISAATALGSIAVDRSNSKTVDDVQKAVQALGIKTADQVEKLYDSTLDVTSSAAAVIPGAVVGTNLNPTVAVLRQAYEQLIKPIKADSFIQDLVNDENGPALHRWQSLIWTILLASYALVEVYVLLTTPQFDSNLLALMGISGLTYVGFKIPEKQPTAATT